MNSAALIFRIGEVKRISHLITAGDDGTGAQATFTVTSVTAYIYNSAGTAVVNGTAGGVDSASAGAQREIFFLWTPDTAGVYTYRLLAVIGTQTLAFQGEVTVLSATSKYDNYVRRIIDWLQISEAGDALQSLSDAQLRGAALEAIRVYSAYKPRRVLLDNVSLTANTWEYNLSVWTLWEKRFSQIEAFECPIDATLQQQQFLNPATDFLIEEARGKWRFTKFVPSTGDTYRMVYSARHLLDDSTDTLATDDSADFDSVCQWAAGEALEQLANKGVHTEGQGIAAGVVNYRDKPQQYSSQARRLKSQAVSKWRPVYVVM